MARTEPSGRDGGRRLFPFLLAVAIVLAAVSSRLPWPVRHILLSPVHVVQGTARTSAGAVGGFFSTLGAKWRAGRENVVLRRRVSELQSQLARTQAQLWSAQRRLQGLTARPTPATFQRLAADVIAGEASPWRESVVAAAGSRAGVRKDMPVIWAGAAAGRVVAVGPATCRILLITDPAFRAAVRFARTGVRGVLRGKGAGTARVDFVKHDADVRQGDLVVTAGIDRVFPANFHVGVCTRSSAGSGELTQQVEVRPQVRGRDLEAVEILLWRPPEEPPPAPELGRGR